MESWRREILLMLIARNINMPIWSQAQWIQSSPLRKLSKYPTLSLNSYYNKNAQRTEFDFWDMDPRLDIAAITVNLNVPIFTGFAANSRIQKARIELQQNINERDNLKISIDHDVQVAKTISVLLYLRWTFRKETWNWLKMFFTKPKKKYAAEQVRKQKSIRLKQIWRLRRRIILLPRMTL
mgnify:CR=1 FL=1